MKKDKLYKVNKWNQPMLMQKGNIFDEGGRKPWQGAIDWTIDNANGLVPWNNTGNGVGEGYSKSGLTAGKAIGAPSAKGGNFLGLSGSDLKGIAGGLGSAVGAGLNGLISGGYNSGAGNAISGIGSTVGGVVGSFNPLLGGALSAASGLIGGAVNALFGEKVDTAALNRVNSDVSRLRGFNSNAGSFDDIKGFTPVSNAGSVYSGGLFSKGSAEEKNRELQKRLDAATAFADRSIGNNVNNLVNNQMGNILASYYAFGGPLEQIGNDGMGAIGYSFMSDYLTGLNDKRKQKDNFSTVGTVPSTLFADGGGIHIKHPGKLTALKERTGKTEAELWAEGRPEVRKMITFARNARKWQKAYGGPLEGKSQDTLFALGGDLQSHGSDWTTGLMSVNAGGSHEMNPNDGVQMGVDQEGTPNLVEEGETIFNDYVYSNRIKVDEETKKRFHLPKKKDFTYAEISKKLEKEASERPNDPISQAALKSQMEYLANEQERQKAEMEAERAKVAFEALSPEEQTALMQQVSQEQAAQEQAMAEEAAAQQTTPSPEEVAMAQQQMADSSQAAIGAQPVMHATGGHLYPDGGELIKRMFKYLGFNTDQDFYKFATDHNLLDLEEQGSKWGEGVYTLDNMKKDAAIWNNMLKGKSFKEAINKHLKDNPGLLHAIQSGLLTPEDVAINSNTMFNPNSRGQWTSTKPSDWWGDWNGKGDTPDYWDESFKQLYQSYIKAGNTPAEAKAAILNLNREDFQNALMGTQAYKDTSKWLHDKDNALKYLSALASDTTGTIPDKAKEYALKYIKRNDNGTYSWIDDNYNYDTVFGGKRGVRTSYPGSYWKTALPAINTPTNTVRNFEIDADGKIHEIITDVPSDWTRVGDPYSWSTKEGNITHNYYRRPKTAEEAATTEEEEQQDVVPVHRAEWPRYAGLFGPAVGLGLQMAGVGKPDYSSLNAVINASNGVAQADYQPIGNYLTYRPMDTWFELNRMDANTRAADRQILNNGLSAGQKMAGLVANNYNSQLGSGELYRKALEYNDALEKQVEDFNRGTNQFNAEAYNRLSQFNADARNRHRQFNAQLGLEAAKERLEGDQWWNSNIYGNLTGLFRGLSDLGKENATKNMIADIAATGLFGSMKPETFIANGMLRYATPEEQAQINASRGKQKATTAAKGGKLCKRKRGLTI